MDVEREPDVDTGVAGSGGRPTVGETAPSGSGADGAGAGFPVNGGADADRERELQDVTERECRLRDLVAEAGFAGTFTAIADLARRWSEHPEVDTCAAAELRLLGRRLDALVRDVGTSTRLN